MTPPLPYPAATLLSLDFFESLLFYVASGGLTLFAGGVCALAVLVVLFFKRRWLLKWARHRGTVRKQAIRVKGSARRQALVVARQRRNLTELAALVKALLAQRRQRLSLGLYHQALERVRHLVATLQFERLHALYELLSTADEDQTPRKLQAFLEQET